MNPPDFAALAADAEWFPHQLDLAARRALFVRLDAQLRREAAFLDERAIQGLRDGVWLPLSPLLQPTDAPAQRADFLFHLGHCGSTLVSRLLDEMPGVEGIREPLPLRTLADAQRDLGLAWALLDEAQWRNCLAQTLALLARPLQPGGRSLVKATSSCNGLIAPMLGILPTARAAFIHVSLANYLATILKSPASRREIALHGPARLQFLVAQTQDLDLRLHALQDAELCAMGWLSEMLRLDRLMASPGIRGRVAAFDFEALLADPTASLAALCTHLEITAGPGALSHVAASDAWRRYSKAQDHAYGRQDRAHDLALARQRFGDEIDAGLRWAEAFVRQHRLEGPLLAPASA